MATAQIVRDKSKINKRPHLKAPLVKASEDSVAAVNCLWNAFHSLNRTAAKISSTSGELMSTSAEAIQEGKRLYQAALVSLENRNYRTAMHQAQAVLDLCCVIDHLIDNDIENILNLRSPPVLHAHPNTSLKKSEHLVHPSLRALNSILIHRGSADGQERKKFSAKMESMLSRVSKCLQVLERPH